MNFAAAEIERLLANLIRVGVVTALDEANARVQVKVGGLSTDWLPWITARAGATRTWSAPRPGEQVLVLSPYGDPAQAVALPAIYQDAYQAPAASKDVDRVVFPDGAVVQYDSAAKVLTVTTAGNVIINCTQATVNASDSVTLNTPQTTCTGNLRVNGNTVVDGTTLSKGKITGQGGLAVSGGTGATVAGNMAITGGEVSADGINLKTHRHGGVQAGGSQTGTPV